MFLDRLVFKWTENQNPVFLGSLPNCTVQFASLKLKQMSVKGDKSESNLKSKWSWTHPLGFPKHRRKHWATQIYGIRVRGDVTAYEDPSFTWVALKWSKLCLWVVSCSWGAHCKSAKMLHRVWVDMVLQKYLSPFAFEELTQSHLDLRA